MSKETRAIEYPAAYVVFWPGQEVYACGPHTRQLQKLNEHMGGAPLSVRLLEDLSEAGECSNCVNEGGHG